MTRVGSQRHRKKNTYTYILIVLRLTINYGIICTIIYRWIQNYSKRSCLSFGYKGKGTTATSEINTFKILSYGGTDIFVCNEELST